MSTDPPLVLVTSTRWPYLRDILDILFLPSGLFYRFRYSPRFIEKSFLANPKKLLNRKAYVVHANTKEGSTQQEYDTLLELLPIREVTIEQVKHFGSFIWLNFRLADWVVYEEESATGLNENHQRVYDATPEQSRQFLTLTLYEAPSLTLQMLADDYTGESEEVAGNWHRIVKNMSRFASHQNEQPTYLKLTSIKDANRGNPIVPCAGGHNLRSGGDYRLEILQYYPYDLQKMEPFPVKLLLDEKRIIPLVNEATIFGRYDSLITSFRPIASLTPYRTILGVEAHSSKRMRLDTKLAAKILTSRSRLIGTGAVVVGIVVATFGPAVVGGNVALAGALTAIAGFLSLYLGGEKQ